MARRKQRRQRKQQTLSTSPEAVSSSENSLQERDQWSMEQLMEWTQGENYERSQLDLFEAFFLVYGIDVLDIQDKVSLLILYIYTYHLNNSPFFLLRRINSLLVLMIAGHYLVALTLLQQHYHKIWITAQH